MIAQVLLKCQIPDQICKGWLFTGGNMGRVSGLQQFAEERRKDRMGWKRSGSKSRKIRP